MRILIAATVLAVALPTLATAQGMRDAAVIIAPQMTNYTIGTGASKRTISQTAIPIVFVLPFTDRFSMDVTTAYAISDVTSGGASVSKINGLTDTQVRANISVGSDAVIFTVGLNLPTGQYTIPPEQQDAAGQIGNDFLNYPVSSMGNGFAGTGGIAFARPVGSWNVGAGASVRKSTEFAAFEVSSAEYRFTPADEFRLRLSMDRPVGQGQVDFGLSYSAFGEDVADTTSYSTGDRLIATGSWSFPVRSANLFLSGWNLYRMEGQRLGGVSPKENVANISAGLSFTVKQVVVQPNIETRLWQVDGARAGNLVNLGMRLRVDAGKFTLYPSAGYSIGTLYSTVDGTGTDVTGVRGSLTLRWN